jgi:multiple sugar transport system substrate-binding protein
MKTTNQYNYYLIYIGGAILLIIAILLFSLINVEKRNTDQDAGVIYLAGHISAAHKIAIDNFNRMQNGKITVKTVDINFKKFGTDEKKELFARFLRGESDKIDMFLIDQIWVPRFAKWCEPLENYFDYSERQNIVPQGLEACSDGEHLVAVPLYVDIALMYYRLDLLKKAGNFPLVKNQLDSSITWEDFIKLGQRIQRKNGTPFFVFQAKAVEGLMCGFVEMMASQNMVLYKNHTVQLNTPEARKALQLMVDLVHTYHLSPPETPLFEETQSYDYFIKHDGLFLRGWPSLDWHYAKGSLEDLKTQQLAKALPPHFKGQKKLFVLGGWNMMISKLSNHKQQSVEFIKYLLSKDVQKTLYEVGDYIPANASLFEDTAYASRHPEIVFYKKLLEKGFHRPFLRDYTKISGIISSSINLAISKKISVEEALLLAEQKINSDHFLIQ